MTDVPLDAYTHIAIKSILQRMEEIAEQCGDKFPLFRRPATEQWKLSTRGSWMGGFWVGLWWLRALVTKSSDDRIRAAHWCSRLEVLLEEPTVNRSFVFWFGPGIGSELHADIQSTQLVHRAAQVLMRGFNERMAAWPLGEGMGGGREGFHLLNVDSLAPLISLMNAGGDPRGISMARKHLNSCLTHLCGMNGAWQSNAVFDASMASLNRDIAGTGLRGQAWAMLGLVESSSCFGCERYLRHALSACDYWRRQWSYLNTTGRRHGGTAPADSCAMAIACVAMLKLWRLIGEPSWLQAQSTRYIEELLTPTVVETGRFVGHYYQTEFGKSELVESPCAMYFLLAVLLIYAGLL